VFDQDESEVEARTEIDPLPSFELPASRRSKAFELTLGAGSAATSTVPFNITAYADKR